MPFAHFIPDQGNPTQSVKPLSCMHTWTQMGSNGPYIGAGEPQQTENTTWNTHSSRDGRQAANAHQLLPMQGQLQKVKGKQVHSLWMASHPSVDSSLLMGGEVCFSPPSLLYEYFYPYSLRQGKRERKPSSHTWSVPVKETTFPTASKANWAPSLPQVRL